MLFVIHAFDKPGHRHVRRAYTDAHVAYLKSQPLKVCLAGPLLSEDDESAIGSLLIVDAANMTDAQQFSQHDPYTKAQLFSTVQITAWRKTVGRID